MYFNTNVLARCCFCSIAVTTGAELLAAVAALISKLAIAICASVNLSIAVF
jgi:hypothetical protein